MKKAYRTFIPVLFIIMILMTGCGKKTCSKPGCDSKPFMKGLCAPHYVAYVIEDKAGDIVTGAVENAAEKTGNPVISETAERYGEDIIDRILVMIGDLIVKLLPF